MKKILVTTAVLGSLASTPAFAKTEGHYVGADFLITNFEAVDAFDEKHDEYSFSGVGLNYKYALNFNNMFIAPVIFASYNNATSKFNDSMADLYEAKLRYSYGAKVEVGYDVTNELAIFATGGFAQNRIREDWSWAGTKEDITAESWIYGGGIKYSVNDQIDVGVAYEKSDYDVRTAHNIDIETIRVGFAFNF